MSTREDTDLAEVAPPSPRAARMPDDARCSTCGYLLRGLPEHRCPECGGAFNPADETTYKSRSHPRRRRRMFTPAALAAPPTKSYIAFVWWICAALLGFGHSPSSRHRMAEIESFLCPVRPVHEIALAIIFLDIARRVVALQIARRKGVKSVSTLWSTTRARYLGIAVPWLTVVFWLAYPWPQAVCFYANRAALQKAADDFLAGRRGTPAFQNVGSIHVHYMLGRADGFAFIQTGWDYEGRHGYAYDPDGARRGGWWLAPGWYYRYWLD